MTKAYFILENGTILKGCSFGAKGTTIGEVVFNTSMSGYQEILTDPSYKGQIVLMTYPQIGNYGINDIDIESEKPMAEGFIVKELSPIASNFRSKYTLDEYLKAHSIVGISDIDTRYLTKILRQNGSMMGMITTQDYAKDELIAQSKSLGTIIGKDLVQYVTCPSSYKWEEPLYHFDFENKKTQQNLSKRPKVIVYDFGTKKNILRHLYSAGFEVIIVNAYSKYEDVKKLSPDAICLSNGPGDPRGLRDEYLQEIKKTILEYPTFGICFGLQIIARIFGAEIYKLKFGHHGANHPVKNLLTEKIEITVQNHNYAAKENSLENNGFEVTYKNLNDNSIEGVKHKNLPIFAVQYHPEASAGPHDSQYLFGEFYKMVMGGVN
ncbi:Carbamoyl-phosphate synthase small chain [Desulfurella amilsii]|uniref:Carbamoyl phosphate synthase small chain n=1 Tax=Desulfurella amilsii TaxID=1562698 RepID=A0A1X4XVA6_9BACT|nr:glutamine-hydrolyzing carbamoyl-phosphate synthase small subunit [Desulfurella amilsii]OSS41438.1 Carbamoyl-phosphate synthase small chain [Desulfurella amilsii]